MKKRNFKNRKILALTWRRIARLAPKVLGVVASKSNIFAALGCVRSTRLWRKILPIHASVLKNVECDESRIRYIHFC